MLLPQPKDTIHKAWLYRLLSAIIDNNFLASVLYFKGGTCAAMRDFLDRFSIDLDFDFVADKKEMALARKNLETIYNDLGLIIKDASSKIPQYFLKYEAESNQRNTVKIDITTNPPQANKYELVRLKEIDRIINCQTIETMFANKLVALIERFEKTGSIAGRDLYDIHYFFLKGFGYDEKIIMERRKTNLIFFLNELINFINTRVNLDIIEQDINMLLPYEKFRKIKNIIKPEVIIFLKDEIEKKKID